MSEGSDGKRPLGRIQLQRKALSSDGWEVREWHAAPTPGTRDEAPAAPSAQESALGEALSQPMSAPLALAPCDGDHGVYDADLALELELGEEHRKRLDETM